LPDGFKAMVPAILILVCAWTLKAMTDSLGAKIFISQLVEGTAGGFQMFLPAIIFAIAVGLSFATGTSWGTFGILIPIVLSVFDASNPLAIISISACMAGAVCGDHCSPISDTTIMSSAGAQCNHINHVSTQLPYALTVAGVSFVTYIIAGILGRIGLGLISLPIGAVLMVATLLVVKKATAKKA
ncbi:MAG: Na+/H+ antiporter NhaC family protein, partial [Clostridia bacterium]|nr:Na+/H+ antiporter NhaC family protein [Clostridia bacterium]